jgi:hypothetical protein
MIERRFARKALFAMPLLLLVALLKIVLVWALPQIGDVPPDALTYQLHGQAIAMHWQVLPVSARDYQLWGLLGRDEAAVWLPEAGRSYWDIQGTSDWLYSAYLALWVLMVEEWAYWGVLSNALFCAGLPLAAFGVARTCGFSPAVALTAGLLTALDLAIAVNAAWSLKDSLAAWVGVMSVWIGAKAMSSGQYRWFGYQIVLIGLSAGIRYVFAVASLSVMLIMSVCLALRGHRRQAVVSFLAIAITPFVAIMVMMLPIAPEVNNFFSLFLSPIIGNMNTYADFTAQTASVTIRDDLDVSVVGWFDRLQLNPLLALTQAIARSLLAPYPWALLKDGATGQNAYELYAFASAQFMLCIPALFAGLWIAVRRHLVQPEVLYVLGILATVCLAYIVFYGEWSTRQRVFLLPVVYVFVALGWVHIIVLVRALIAGFGQGKV